MVLRLCGHVSIGPSDVPVPFLRAIRSPQAVLAPKTADWSRAASAARSGLRMAEA